MKNILLQSYTPPPTREKRDIILNNLNVSARSRHSFVGRAHTRWARYIYDEEKKRPDHLYEVEVLHMTSWCFHWDESEMLSRSQLNN